MTSDEVRARLKELESYVEEYDRACIAGLRVGYNIGDQGRFYALGLRALLNEAECEFGKWHIERQAILAELAALGEKR